MEFTILFTQDNFTLGCKYLCYTAGEINRLRKFGLLGFGCIKSLQCDLAQPHSFKDEGTDGKKWARICLRSYAQERKFVKGNSILGEIKEDIKNIKEDRLKAKKIRQRERKRTRVLKNLLNESKKGSIYSGSDTQ